MKKNILKAMGVVTAFTLGAPTISLPVYAAAPEADHTTQIVNSDSNLIIEGDVEIDNLDNQCAVVTTTQGHDASTQVNGDVIGSGEGAVAGVASHSEENTASTVIVGDVQVNNTSKDAENSQLAMGTQTLAYEDGKSYVIVEGDVIVSSPDQAYGIVAENTSSDEQITAPFADTVIIGNVGVVADKSAIGVNSYNDTNLQISAINGNIESYGVEDSRGISAWAYGENTVSDVIVNGDITSGSENVAIGVYADAKDGSTVNILTANISAHVEGDETAGSYGIVTGSYVPHDDTASVDSTVNITALGDVTTNRIGLLLADSYADVNVTVEGTITGSNSAIASNTKDASQGSNITVWALATDDDGNYVVYAPSAEDPGINTTYDEEFETEFLKNVNYIIKSENSEGGYLKISGLSDYVDPVTGNEYDTAKGLSEIIIKVDVSDGYELEDVKNGDTKLEKIGDNKYRLIVPKNGAVNIKAILYALTHDEDVDNSSSTAVTSADVMNKAVEAVATASNATADPIVLEMGNWVSFNRTTAQSITKQIAAKNLLIKFQYKSVKYQLTIPAGTDLTKYLDENGFVGFCYLGTIFQMVEVQ